MVMVFEVVALQILKVGEAMAHGVEDEGDTTVPQVLGLALAVQSA